jgi:hypothetical protein
MQHDNLNLSQPELKGMDMTNTGGKRRSAWAQTEAETRELRDLSTRLAIPGLCGARACRRARACRGHPDDCLERYEPLIAEDAREGAEALREARLLGRPFGELDEEWGEEVRALVRWQDAVAATRRNRR